MSRIRRRKGTEGTVAIEFALLLPVLLAILLGIMDYGWVYFVRLNMTNAAREGARVGVTRDTPTGAAGTNCIGGAADGDAVCTAKAYLDNAGVSYDSVTATDPSSDPQDAVTVTVSINNFQPLVGFVPTPSAMTVQAAMRWELAGVGP